MKKLFSMIVLLLVLGTLFAAEKEPPRSEINSFLTKYEKTASELVSFVDSVIKGKEKQVEQKYKSINEKINQLQYKEIPLYAPYLNDNDMKRIDKANEKILDAAIKLQTWMENNYYFPE